MAAIQGKPIRRFSVTLSDMPAVPSAYIYHLIIILILRSIKPAFLLYIVTSLDAFISESEANEFRGVAFTYYCEMA